MNAPTRQAESAALAAGGALALAERIRANPMVTRVLEKVAGLFLVGFGIKLAVSH